MSQPRRLDNRAILFLSYLWSLELRMPCDQPLCDEAAGLKWYNISSLFQSASFIIFMCDALPSPPSLPANGERQNTLRCYICQQVPVWIAYMSVCVCVFDWLTHCTVALLGATGHPMLIHPHPAPTLSYALLPHPFTSLPLLTSLFYSPFPLLPQVWVWKLERGQLTQQPVHQTQAVEEGSVEREKAHITTHWPTYTSTQLIESYVEARGQSQVGVECQPANGIGHSSQSSCTVSVQFSVIIQRQGEWARQRKKGWQMRVTENEQKKRDGRGWEWGWYWEANVAQTREKFTLALSLWVSWCGYHWQMKANTG